MYTGTPKADMNPMPKHGFFDENFVGSSLSKQKVTNDNIDFIEMGSSENDGLYKKQKAIFEDGTSEMARAGARAPLHQGAQPNARPGQRGNSPATGAIAGPPSSEPVLKGSSNAGIASENKSMSHNTSAMNTNCDDSFQKLYSKELDLDEDEVPLILNELNDSAIHFISKDQYDRALSLLQKAQTLLDRLMFQRNRCDRFLIQCTMHNMALCFQKMGAIEECSLCLDACLNQLQAPSMQNLYKSNPSQKLKKLKYECKIHMQVCALLSQLNRHQEALCHAKQSVQIAQYMMQDLMELCEFYDKRVATAKQRELQAQELISKGGGAAQKFQKMFLKDSPDIKEIEGKLNKSDLIYFDEQVSMLERTAHKYYPIIQEVNKRMVKNKEMGLTGKDGFKFISTFVQEKTNELRKNMNDKSMANSINMRVLLGYLNQSEWMYLLNIGNIMQITPLTIHDLLAVPSIEIELARDSVIEKISFLAVSYFCVSTELRFLVNLKDNPNVDPVQIRSESEYWHGKALEISCTFLPSESPLVSHILSSYTKHHAPVKQIINEDRTAADDQINLKIIRPLQGIDQCKQCPMVRANKHMHIALSPLSLSPNNYTRRQIKPFQPSSWIQIQDQNPGMVSKPTSRNAEVALHSGENKDSFIFNDDSLPLDMKMPEKGLNDEFNKITTLDFKSLRNDESTSRQNDSSAQIDFAPQTRKESEAGRTQKCNPQKENEGPKHMPRAEQLGDLSSIMKDKPHEEEATLQSIELRENIERAFQSQSSSQQNLHQSYEASRKPQMQRMTEDGRKDHPEHSHQLVQQIKYLKDTTIDNSLLQKQQQNEAVQQVKYKSRPKTSENQKRSDKVISLHPQAQKRESPNDQKFKSSTATRHDTLEQPNQTSTISYQNNVSSDQLLHQHNTINQKASRPFTQQNFYTEQSEKQMQQHGTSHHTSHNQNQRPKLEANGITQVGNPSCSVTSGVTSQSGTAMTAAYNQQRIINGDLNLSSEKARPMPQQKTLTERVSEANEVPQQHPQGQNMNLHLDVQAHSQRLLPKDPNHQHITPKNKQGQIAKIQQHPTAQPQSRYKQNNQILSSAVQPGQVQRQLQTALNSSRNNGGQLLVMTASKENMNGLKQHQIQATVSSKNSNLQLSNSNLHCKKTQHKMLLESTSDQTFKTSPHQKSKERKFPKNSKIQQLPSGGYLTQQQSQSGSREREGGKNMFQTHETQKVQNQHRQKPQIIAQNNAELQVSQKQMRTTAQTPTSGQHPNLRHPNQPQIAINQMFQVAQNERSSSGGHQGIFSHQNSGSKMQVQKQQQLQLKQQQFLISQQQLMTKLQKNGSHNTITNRKPSATRQQPLQNQQPQRQSSAKNKQVNQTQIHRYNSNQRNNLANQSLQELTSLHNQSHGSIPKSHNQHKSRNGAAGNLNAISKTTQGDGLMQPRAAGKGNITFNEDMSNMRNMQMQIQQKLTNMQQKTKVALKGQKHAKSTEKIQNVQTFSSVQPSGQNTQRGKLQINMKAIGSNGQNGSSQTSTKRQGAIQTMRSNDAKKINFIGPSHKFIIDQSNPQLNLNNFQTLNTYNINSLEASLDSNMLPFSHQQHHAVTHVQSAVFPSTPNVQSALQTSRSSQSTQQQVPGVGGYQKVAGLKRQENSYELMQRQARGAHLEEHT